MSARQKDIPELQRDGKNLNAVMAALHEVVQTYRGYRGDPLDRALTIRDLDDTNRKLVLIGQQTAVSSGGMGATGPQGPQGPPGTITPDPTAPPQPTGLVVTAGLSYLYINCDVPSYTQGHGHGLTVVYGAKWPTGAAAPTFSSAVELFSFTGNFSAYPTDTGTRWAIWIKWKSADGYLSVAPAGGTNGVVATTGLVGGSDLGPLVVLAGNLAPGSVTADKTALDLGGDNLLGNNSFEVSTAGLADGWTRYNNTSGTEGSTTSMVAGRISGFAQKHAWTGSNTSTKGMYPTGLLRGGWVAGKTYVVSWYATASNSTAPMNIEWNRGPASVVAIKNPNLSPTWQRYAFRIVWGGSVEALGRLFPTITDAATGNIVFDDFQIEEGDTLSGYSGKLALNTIVAGDGAIGNLAIVNAMIADATIDNAKVANLSAAKLTVGDGTIGGNLKSTVYTPGLAGWIVRPDGTAEFDAAVIRGQLVASQIVSNLLSTDNVLTRGLTVRDNSGNIIFGVGQNLDFSRIGGTTKPADNANVGSMGGFANTDPYLLAPKEWTFGPPGSGSATASYYANFITGPGLTSAWDKPDGRSQEIYSAPFPVSEYKTYRIDTALYMWAANTAVHYFFVAFYKADGTLLTGSASSVGWPSSGTFHYFGLTGTSQAAGASTYTHSFGAGATAKIPANAAYAKVGILGNYNNTTDRWSWGGARVKDIITSENVTTFMANAAIGNAQIGGDIYSTVFTTGSAGWIIKRDGTAEFNNVRVRGDIAGGAYTGYAWPAAGATGFYLGPSGLLLGNGNSGGRYFQVTEGGDVYAPGFTIIAGVATFSGALSAASGTFGGEMRFSGNRGDGVVELISSIGLSANGADTVIANFGSLNSSRVGVWVEGRNVRVMRAIAHNSGTALSATADGTAVAVNATAASGIAVSGASTSSYGMYGSSSAVAGVRGEATTGPGVQGVSSSSGPGVDGSSASGAGVNASSTTGYGGSFTGNATKAPIFLTPRSTPPSGVANGCLCFLSTPFGNRLCFADGGNWYRVGDNLVWSDSGGTGGGP